MMVNATAGAVANSFIRMKRTFNGVISSIYYRTILHVYIFSVSGALAFGGKGLRGVAPPKTVFRQFPLLLKALLITLVTPSY